MNIPFGYRKVAFALCSAFFGLLNLNANDGTIPHVQILAIDSHAAEQDSASATAIVVRWGSLGSALEVKYDVSGTAENGVDYEELPGSVTIPAGLSFALVEIHPFDDDIEEGNERVVLKLRDDADSAYELSWPGRAVFKLEDNDSTENSLPVVEITTPPNGSVFTAPLDLRLAAFADDRDGRVVQVEFFADDESIGVVLIPEPLPFPFPLPLDELQDVSLGDVIAGTPSVFPDFAIDPSGAPIISDVFPVEDFSLLWADVPLGEHSITAVATDNKGAKTRSNPVRIKVLEAPSQTLVGIVAEDPVASEGASATGEANVAVFRIKRSEAGELPLRVNYTIKGTATNGIDYKEIASSVIIPAGKHNARIVIEAIDDDLVEGRESVGIELLPDICATTFVGDRDCYHLSSNSGAVAYIRDNDKPNENPPPSVHIVRPLDGSVFTTPTDVILIAEAKDRNGWVRSVEFFANNRSLGTIYPPVFLDSVTGAGGSLADNGFAPPTDGEIPPFTLNWNDVPAGKYVLTAEATDNDGAKSLSEPVEIKVVDKTPRPVVSIQATDAEAHEGRNNPDDPREGGAEIAIAPDTATFTISRKEVGDEDLIVYYRVGGAASNGSDYREIKHRAIIPAGEKSVEIAIVPIDDKACEGKENVIIALVPPFATELDFFPAESYRIGQKEVAEAFIIDNDKCDGNAPPVCKIVDPEDGAVYKEGQSVEVLVRAFDRDGTIARVALFAGEHKIGVIEGPHLATNMYSFTWEEPAPGKHTLHALATDDEGENTRSEEVGIVVIEKNERTVVRVRATDPLAVEGAILVGPQLPGEFSSDGTDAVGTNVVGDDGVTLLPPVFLDTAAFTFSRTGDAGFALDVPYAVGGSASNGEDYEEISGVVHFPEGVSTVTLIISPKDDNLVEGDEKVVIELEPAACPEIFPVPFDCYLIGEHNRAVAVIKDNDRGENEAPLVEIVAPQSGENFESGSRIEIKAHAFDLDGYVRKVAFYANGDKIGEVKVFFDLAGKESIREVFSFVWANAPLGKHTLIAVATDNNGAVGESNAVEIAVIESNDNVFVSIEATDPIAAEGSRFEDALPVPLDPTTGLSFSKPDILDTATFTVSRSSGMDRSLTVAYRISGEASNGEDYFKLEDEVTILSGERSARITIHPFDDDLIEGTENIVLSLIPPLCDALFSEGLPTANTDGSSIDCYKVSRERSKAEAFIRDNDFDNTNQPPFVSILSPEDGLVIPGPTSVNLLAHAGDLDGIVQFVEFFANGKSLGIVENNPIFADPLRDTEGNVARPDILPIDLFELVWEKAEVGEYQIHAVATDNLGESSESESVHISITEGTNQAIVSVYATDPIASEGTPFTHFLDAARLSNAEVLTADGVPADSGDIVLPDILNTATFTIERTGNLDVALSVDFVLEGNATNGEDYDKVSTSVKIPEGAKSIDVLIVPVDDDKVEGEENIALILKEDICLAIFPPPADCYLLGRNKAARAVIRDNDSDPSRPPAVAIVAPQSGDAFKAPADILISANAWDFDGVVQSVEFFEGDNSLGVVHNPIIPIPLSDALSADNGANVADILIAPPAFPVFEFKWADVPPGRYALTAVATDNDGLQTRSQPVKVSVLAVNPLPSISIRASDPEASEERPVIGIIDQASFVVTRTGPLDELLEVRYVVAGTATNGEDYDELSGSVTFLRGADKALISVYPIDDALCEGDESVIIGIAPGETDDSFPPARLDYALASDKWAKAVIIDDETCTNEPPELAIVRPQDGSSFEAPASMKIVVKAKDSDGHVEAVELFSNGDSIGFADAAADERSVFVMPWEGVEAGKYSLTAVAIDNDGNSTPSDPVDIEVVKTVITQPIVNVFASDKSAAERANVGDTTRVAIDTGTFTVTRRGGDMDAPLDVFYSVRGSASNGEDYIKLSGVISIPENSHSATIFVEPIDDELVEGTETVVLQLEQIACFAPGPGCYLVGERNHAVVSIKDNDTQSNHPPRVEIVRPTNGEHFSAPANIEIVALANDVDGWVRLVEFYSGDRKIGEAKSDSPDDTTIAHHGKFRFDWKVVPKGKYDLTAVATDNVGKRSKSSTVSVVVSDSHELPEVSIVARDPAAIEFHKDVDGDDPAVFVVRRSGNTEFPLTVRYRIGGSATNGEDYQELSGIVTIPEGASSEEIVIRPLPDEEVEAVESVRLTIQESNCDAATGSSCYTIGSPRGDIAFIKDSNSVTPDNLPPSVAIVRPQNGSRFGAPADIEVVIAASDPDGWVGLVELIANGEVIKEAAITFIVAPEPGQRQVFEMNWFKAPVGSHVLVARATDNNGVSTLSDPVEIKIIEEYPAPVVTIIARDGFASEGLDKEGNTNSAVFKVRRKGDTLETLSVNYAIAGSATNGEDYALLSGRVTIPAGEKSASIVVEPFEDEIVEKLETVILKLVSTDLLTVAFEGTEPVGLPYIVGRPAKAAAIIKDNDRPRPDCQLVSDDLFHVCLPGNNGFSYRLETSTNLVDWEPVTTNTVVDGAIHYVDHESNELVERFYRVVDDEDTDAEE